MSHFVISFFVGCPHATEAAIPSVIKHVIVFIGEFLVVLCIRYLP